MTKLGKGQLKLGQLNTLIHEVRKTTFKGQLVNLLIWVKDQYFFDKIVKKPYQSDPSVTMPKGLKNFLKCIGSESAVCSYLPPTPQNLDLLDDMFDGIRQKPYKLKLLQHELPVFFDLAVDVRDTDITEDQQDVPLVFKAMILHLKDVAKKPFQCHVPEVVSAEKSSLSWLVFYVHHWV